MEIKTLYQKMNTVANIYKECFNSPVFHAFIDNLSSCDSNTNITAILVDTYNYYTKHCKCWGDIKWQEAIKDAREIESKHNNELCRLMLVQLTDLIEKQYTGGTNK